MPDMSTVQGLLAIGFAHTHGAKSRSQGCRTDSPSSVDLLRVKDRELVVVDLLSSNDHPWISSSHICTYVVHTCMQACFPSMRPKA
jgi:hypothetical protein